MGCSVWWTLTMTILLILSTVEASTTNAISNWTAVVDVDADAGLSVDQVHNLQHPRQARGMSDQGASTVMEVSDTKEARKSENWGSQYYDFLINEGSYKFWSVFQLVTAALLIYSAFAAIYYAKFNLITADYDYGDYFYGRAIDSTPQDQPWLGLNAQTFQNILNAISSKQFT